MADNNGTPLPAGAPYDRGEQLKMWLGGEAELPPGAPYNRDEQLIMWLGDEAELPPGAPYNRDEQLTMWLKDHIGGGGNPNYVENITGTLANPWGTVDIAEIVDDCSQLKATMYLLIDGTGIGMSEVELSLQRGGITSTDVPFGSAGVYTTESDIYFNGALVVFDISTGAATVAAVQNNGMLSNVLPYASQLPTLLTIIHHPLPDTTP